MIFIPFSLASSTFLCYMNVIERKPTHSNHSQWLYWTCAISLTSISKRLLMTFIKNVRQKEKKDYDCRRDKMACIPYQFYIAIVMLSCKRLIFLPQGSLTRRGTSHIFKAQSKWQYGYWFPIKKSLHKFYFFCCKKEKKRRVITMYGWEEHTTSITPAHTKQSIRFFL